MLFYLCEHCGIIISKINPDGIVPACCEQHMTKLIAKSVNNLAIGKQMPVGQKENRIIRLVH
jgi:hypothetical protein